MASSSIKSEFGKRFRSARDANKLSRAALGLRLGISPKTIQSWEMGRTFIEDLSLIPAIEAELGISVSDLIAESTGGERRDVAAESPKKYGKRKPSRPVAGPAQAQFDIQPLTAGPAPDPEKLTAAFASVPMVRPQTLARPISELVGRNIIDHVIIPKDWAPRGGVLIATRMGDSGMAPMIPLGATIIVDHRPMQPEKALNKVVALDIKGKGVRIRRLVQVPGTDQFRGLPALEGRRGKVNFRPNAGDIILGRIVGILSQPE